MSENKSLTSATVSGVVWKFLERITAQFVSLLVSIVLARILLPEDYGIVTLVMIFISICNVFVSNGFGVALVQKKKVDELDFSSVFWANVGFSLVLYAIIFFGAIPFSTFFENDLLLPVLQVMGLRIPFAAVNSVQHAYIQRRMQFKSFFWATLVGTVTSGVVGICMALSGFGVWALVAQYLTNVVIDTLALTIIVRWRPRFIFAWGRLKILLKFGWKMLASGLLDTGYNELYSLIIGKKYSSEDLAFYDQGKRYPSFLVTNLDLSITSVLLPAMSKVQDDKEKIKLATRKSIQLSSFLILPCCVGIAAVAPQFVHLVLTDKWLPMVPYLQIMCFVYALMPMQTANLTAIQAKGRSDLFLVLEIIKKAIGITSILISMWFGVIWIAITSMIVTVIGYIINAWPNRYLLGYGHFEQIKDLCPNLLVATLMGIPVYFLNYLPLDSILIFVLQIVCGLILYFSLSLITKNKSLFFIIKLLKGFSKRDRKTALF